MFLEQVETFGYTTEKTAKQYRLELAEMLRNPAKRPAEFGPWNYKRCSTCALGLAALAWNLEGDWCAISRKLGLDSKFGPGLFFGKTAGTRPKSIARALEAYPRKTLGYKIRNFLARRND
jgi:hypothetical protein